MLLSFKGQNNRKVLIGQGENYLVNWLIGDLLIGEIASACSAGLAMTIFNRFLDWARNDTMGDSFNAVVRYLRSAMLRIASVEMTVNQQNLCVQSYA